MSRRHYTVVVDRTRRGGWYDWYVSLWDDELGRHMATRNGGTWTKWGREREIKDAVADLKYLFRPCSVEVLSE